MQKWPDGLGFLRPADLGDHVDPDLASRAPLRPTPPNHSLHSFLQADSGTRGIAAESIWGPRTSNVDPVEAAEFT